MNNNSEREAVLRITVSHPYMSPYVYFSYPKKYDGRRLSLSGSYSLSLPSPFTYSLPLVYVKAYID